MKFQSIATLFALAAVAVQVDSVFGVPIGAKSSTAGLDVEQMSKFVKKSGPSFLTFICCFPKEFVCPWWGPFLSRLWYKT